MTSLRPYQQVGAAFLASRKHALLADDMGLGKTAQAIAACDEVGARNVLVVCPASVCETWRREFARWSWTGIRPGVVSYDRAARGTAMFFVDVECRGEVDVLILDEAHYLKSATSKRTRAIFGEGCDGSGLVSRAKRVILLSGTPMPNHPAELWPALRALAPETIQSTTGKPYSYWQFVKKFCKTKDNGFGIQIVGGKNHDDLKDRLKPFMLRRLKSEVLKDLPPIQFEPLYVEGRIAHNAESRAEEWAIATVLRDEGVEGLKEMAGHVATLRRLTGLAKMAPCVEWIKDFLESGRKLVVFAHHREVIDGLAEKLNQTGNFVRIDGHTQQWARQEAIDRFQTHDDYKLFIGQIQAAGTGITLTAASDVLFVESDWVPANVQQAAARVHRIGQSEPCLVRFATLAGSIDEDIERALVRKMNDIEKVLDGV